MAQPRKFISSDTLAPPVGPYSPGVYSNGILFLSGQVGTDANGRMVEGGVEAQTEQALKKIGVLLQVSGASYHDVVKTTVFLLDMADFSAMNQVYAKFFDKGFPARSTVAVVGLPLGARVEIEVMAIPRQH